MIDGTRADKQRVGYVGDVSVLPSWMHVGDLLGFESRLRPDLDFSRLHYRLPAPGDSETTLRSLPCPKGS